MKKMKKKKKKKIKGEGFGFGVRGVVTPPLPPNLKLV